jgi:aryl-alcohol dehydrogenase-like predicted oxidoreductase
VQSRGENVVPIPGTKRRKYLEENVAAVGLDLSVEDITAIEKAVPINAVAGGRYPEAGMGLIGK